MNCVGLSKPPLFIFDDVCNVSLRYASPLHIFEFLKLFYVASSLTNLYDLPKENALKEKHPIYCVHILINTEIFVRS